MPTRQTDENPRNTPAQETERSDRDKERELDAALRDSFPASDPVSVTQPTASRTAERSGSVAKAGDHTRDELLKKHDRVNLSDDDEVKYWTERLGVSKDKLSAAVREVGFFPTDVANHLGKTL